MPGGAARRLARAWSAAYLPPSPRSAPCLAARFVMRTAPLLALLVLLLAAARPVHAQDARPADVASPEALVTAAYEAIQRAPGEAYDWDRFRSLFLPGALLIPNTEQTGGAFRPLSPEAFIARVDSFTVVGGAQDRGFSEDEVHHVVHRFGDVAQVFSTYEKHFWGEEAVLGRGINAFNLVQSGGRWWIASIIWDEETGAGPVPAVYR